MYKLLTLFSASISTEEYNNITVQDKLFGQFGSIIIG